MSANKRDVNARRRSRKARTRQQRRERNGSEKTTSGATGVTEKAPVKGNPEKDASTRPVRHRDASNTVASDSKKTGRRQSDPKSGKTNVKAKARGDKKRLTVRQRVVRAGGIGIAAGLVVGALLGYVNAPDVKTTGLGTTTIAETDTSKQLATYTRDHVTHDVTMADYVSWAQLSSSNGAYTVPAATDVVSYIQNAIELEEADKAGITVDDSDVDAYITENFGEDQTAASLASTYSMDEATVRSLLSDSVKLSKLRDEKAGTIDVEMPTSPTSPEEGQEDTPTQEYADYVISAAGDEWDSSANDGAGGWADESSEMATALADYDITNDSATYDAAQAAYNVLYARYSSAASEVTTKWDEWVNDILKNVTIQLESALIS